MDRHELLTEIRSGRKKLRQTLEKVDPARREEPVLDGGWSVKDVLAHLAFWERRVVVIYRALKNGREPSPSFKDRDMDEINAEVYAERRDWPLAKVTQEEEAAYQEMLDMVDNAPEEDLFSPYCFEWTNGTPFYEWVEGNSYGHYDEHTAMLEKAGTLFSAPPQD